MSKPITNIQPPRARAVTERRQKSQRTEKDLFTSNTYKIALHEVFEKFNDLKKTKPLKNVIASNLAYTAFNHNQMVRTVNLERITAHRFFSLIVSTVLAKKVSAKSTVLARHPALAEYLRSNDVPVMDPTFVASNLFEHFSDLISHEKTTENFEGIEHLMSTAIFKKAISDLNLGRVTGKDLGDQRTGDGDSREAAGLERERQKLRLRMLRLLKTIFSCFGSKALYSFSGYKCVEDTLKEDYADNDQKTKLYLLNEIQKESRKVDEGSVQAAAPSRGSQGTGATSALAHPQTPLLALRAEAQGQGSAVPINPDAFRVETDRELPKAKQQAKRDIFRQLIRDPTFHKLMNPFFRVGPEPSFYADFVERTFKSGANVPKSFEQVVTYFPNYALLNSLMTKSLPQQDDRDRTPFILQSLFPQLSTTQSFTLEDYLERIVLLVQNADRQFLPYLLEEDHHYKWIVGEICAKRMVILNLNKDAVVNHTVGSVDDPFFSQIPVAFRNNLRVLFHVYQANKTYSTSPELALAALNTHYYMASLGLNLQLLIRLTAFVKFISGEKIYLVYENRVPSEFIYRETLRAFSEQPEEPDVKTKEAFNDFSSQIKRAGRMEFSLFVKRQDNREKSYSENLLQILSRHEPRPEEPKNDDFFSSSVPELRLTPAGSMWNREIKYDYKKLLSFKKTIKAG